jgi:hypothetical protein
MTVPQQYQLRLMEKPIVFSTYINDNDDDDDDGNNNNNNNNGRH